MDYGRIGRRQENEPVGNEGECMNNIKEVLQKMGTFRLLAVAACGVLLLVISCQDVWGGSEEKAKESGWQAEEEADGMVYEDSARQYQNRMEEELECILKTVDGVGSVEVMLTVKASNEKVTLKDNTSKGDANEEETVLIEDADRNSAPYVIQEKQPEIEGVVVVCDGGSDAFVKREIMEAVSALFQIESHKIKIMKCKEAKE